MPPLMCPSTPPPPRRRPAHTRRFPQNTILPAILFPGILSIPVCLSLSLGPQPRQFFLAYVRICAEPLCQILDATDGTTGPLRPAFFNADALALPCMLYALTRIVGYPRHEVRNEDRLPFVQRFHLKRTPENGPTLVSLQRGT